jgi:hypothetical protein
MTRRIVIRVVLVLLAAAGAWLMWWCIDDVWGPSDLGMGTTSINYFGPSDPDSVTVEALALRSALFGMILPGAATLTAAALVGLGLSIVIPRWRGKSLPVR